MYVENVKLSSALNRANAKSKATTTSPASTFMAQDNTKEQGKKSGISAKKLTDALGVMLWGTLVITGAVVTKLFVKSSPEQLKKAAEKTKTKAKQALEEIEAKNNPNAEVKKGLAYKLADKFSDWTGSLGEELYNNILYAIGTIVIMPLVVLFSPSHNKKADKKADADNKTNVENKTTTNNEDNKDTENNVAVAQPKAASGSKVRNFLRGDKFFAIIRQPFSVLSTFGMQFTFDKLLSKRIPEVIKRNTLEDSKLLKDGKFISIVEGKPVLAEGVKLEELLSKIKYNTDEAETVLKELVKVEPKDGGLKGIISEEQLKEILNEENLKSYEKKDRDVLSKKLANFVYEKFNIKEELISESEKIEKKVFGLVEKDKDAFTVLSSENVSKDFSKDAKQTIKIFREFLDVHSRKEIMSQRTKVGANVGFSAIIGYTFLNVIYGRFMHSLQNHLNKKEQEAQKKAMALRQTQDNKMKEVA